MIAAFVSAWAILGPILGWVAAGALAIAGIVLILFLAYAAVISTIAILSGL